MEAPSDFQAVVDSGVSTLVHASWKDNSDDEDGFFLMRKGINILGDVYWSTLNYAPPGATSLDFYQVPSKGGKEKETYQITAFIGPQYGPWTDQASSNEVEVITKKVH